MTGDPFLPVKPGDDFVPSAAAWNGAMAAAKYVADRTTGNSPGRVGTRDAGVVRVKNVGSLVAKKYSVVSASGLSFNAPQISKLPPESLALEVQPGGEASDPGWMIAQEAILIGEHGAALASGVTWARLSVTDENQRFLFADPASSPTGFLEPSPFGSAQILWKPEETGEVWGVVRVGMPSDIMLAGYAVTDIAKNESGMVMFVNDSNDTFQKSATAELGSVSAGKLCYVRRRLKFTAEATISSLVIVNAECG